jgi:hypothetical protein
VDIALHDVLGRRRLALRERASGAPQISALKLGALPAGLYELRVSDGVAVAQRNVVVLR